MIAIKMMAGEKSIERFGLTSFYIFHVRNDGMEESLFKCPIYDRASSKKEDKRQRFFILDGKMKEGTVLKIISRFSTFGKPTEYKEMYIRLSSKANKIRITGIHEVGFFEGNAEVLKGDLPVEVIQNVTKIRDIIRRTR
jgi:hypothetical protein